MYTFFSFQTFSLTRSNLYCPFQNGASFLLSCFLVVHCYVATCCERAGQLALLYVMFIVFLSLSYHGGVLGQVWCLIVSIPDLCLLSFFGKCHQVRHKQVWPRGYITFSMLNSAEHEIHPAHKI